ncbi:MAG TPA: AI-2E family transporter YdiK [Gemmatimonadales bacterium]|nr:AI-2E family transporter YdiK [Gemmatimonadales bacterium]
MDALVARDLTRSTLAVLFIVGMIVASFWVLRPFVPAAIWATMIVVASWPLMVRVQSMLWGRRGLAVAVMTLALLLGLLLPLALALTTIVAHSQDIADGVQWLATWSVPPPPDWLEQLPLLGPRLAVRWKEAAAIRTEDVSASLAPYTRQIIGWILGTVGTIGMVLVQFLLVILIAALLYASGETVGDGVRRFARRLAGAQGEHSARLAAQAIRGVALGIIVTALVQACLAGFGLFMAGVPYAAVLTAVVFALSIAQLGPLPVLVLAVVWTYWSGSTGWAVALLLWTVFVTSIDNVLRPILIRKGADLPLWLVFSGVVGGLLAFGIVGLFVGPVVLAVSYSLLADWINRAEPAPLHD